MFFENSEKSNEMIAEELLVAYQKGIPEYMQELIKETSFDKEKLQQNEKRIYFAHPVDPDSKKRVGYTFIERMYYKIYQRYPTVTEIQIENNKIVREYRDHAVKKMRKLIEEGQYNNENFHCFLQWIMGINDNPEDILLHICILLLCMPRKKETIIKRCLNLQMR